MPEAGALSQLPRGSVEGDLVSFSYAAYLMISALIGIGAMSLVVAIVRHEKDAALGRRLLAAAGSEDLARLAIAEANAERLIRQRALDQATDDVFRRGARVGVALRLVKW